MLSMSLETFLIQLGYVGILFGMASVGFFGFFPPSKILYILAGYGASIGNFSLFLIFTIGALGHTIGNFLQYELARRKGLKYLRKFRVFPENEIRKLQIAFDKRGNWFLFVGKLLDPIKIFISICAGISKMNRVAFGIIIYITSFIWATIFTLLGFYLGKSYENFGFVGLVILALGIIVIIYIHKYMNSDIVLNEVNKKN